MSVPNNNILEYISLLLYNSHHAGVMELVDVADSKSAAGNSMPVRVRPPAPPLKSAPLLGFLVAASCFIRLKFRPENPNIPPNVPPFSATFPGGVKILHI